ncbi:MAG: hypothetical protein ACOZCL_18405 [Bacillota bacterium]
MRSFIYDILEKHIPDKKARLIGINGVDTSGKTQFAMGLEQHLKSVGYKTLLIHMDDFHNPSRIRRMGDNPIDSYINNAFNLQLLEKELLEPFRLKGRLDRKLTLLDLDKDTYTLEKEFTADEDTIVILEGVLLYREPIDKYFDIRVFLDISFDEVLRRAEIRDVPRYGIEFLDRYRTRYIPIQQRYLDECKPLERCQFVIDNTDYHKPVLR